MIRYLLSRHSMRFLLSIAILALSADFIANDKPIILTYKGSLYMPIYQSLSEEFFGGELETEAMYKDPYVRTLIGAKGWVLWPPIPYSYDSVDYDIQESLPAPPSMRHWLGTDEQGRDILARLLYGTRSSLVFGLGITLISLVLGTTLGAIQGYFGGMVDLCLQRFSEAWASVPMLFVFMILSSLLRPSFIPLILLLGAFKWVHVAPLIRVEFLRYRSSAFVLAARAMGVNPFVIIVRHILPNALSSALVQMPFMLVIAISLLTTLDFLGLGLSSDYPSFGEMLNQGKNNIYAPWISISALLGIISLLVPLVFLGDNIRKYFHCDITLMDDV